MSELSDISIENPAVGGSPTDSTMMHGETKKAATSSSFLEQVKNTLGNFLGTGTGDEVDNKEEDEDNREIDDSVSHVSFNSSTQENEAPENTENGYSDQFGAIRTINKIIDGIQQSRQLTTLTKSDMQSATTKVTGSGTTQRELEA